MTLEMGKLVGAAADEAAKCATACRYYAERGEEFMRPEIVATSAEGRAAICFEPLGVVLAVMPWNFPFWQVVRFAAPALVAGNVGLLKHASNVPQCALAIEALFRRAGSPRGVFQTLLIESEEVAALIADPGVAAVTVTGCEAAGRAVGGAGGAPLKKSVLELGGSDPFLVLASAEFDHAVAAAVKARWSTTASPASRPSASSSPKRSTIASRRRLPRRWARWWSATRSDPKTQIGPLATAAIRDGVAEQVARSVAAGGRVLTGGRRSTAPATTTRRPSSATFRRRRPRRATRSSGRSPRSSGSPASTRRSILPTTHPSASARAPVDD